MQRRERDRELKQTFPDGRRFPPRYFFWTFITVLLCLELMWRGEAVQLRTSQVSICHKLCQGQYTPVLISWENKWSDVHKNISISAFYCIRVHILVFIFNGSTFFFKASVKKVVLRNRSIVGICEIMCSGLGNSPKKIFFCHNRGSYFK